MIKFNKEKSMKLIAVLGNAKFDVSNDDKVKLNEYVEELIHEIASKYKINLNEEYIDILTLESKSY